MSRLVSNCPSIRNHVTIQCSSTPVQRISSIHHSIRGNISSNIKSGTTSYHYSSNSSRYTICQLLQTPKSSKSDKYYNYAVQTACASIVAYGTLYCYVYNDTNMLKLDSSFLSNTLHVCDELEIVDDYNHYLLQRKSIIHDAQQQALVQADQLKNDGHTYGKPTQPTTTAGTQSLSYITSADDHQSHVHEHTDILPMEEAILLPAPQGMF